MASKFIIVGNCRGNGYFLNWEMQWGRSPKWSWQGLMENATLFEGYKDARSIEVRMDKLSPLETVVLECDPELPGWGIEALNPQFQNNAGLH